MKPINIALSFVVIVALFSTPAGARNPTFSLPAVDSPEAVIRQFYAWYIHSISHQIDPLKADKITLKKYVTAGLILKIERIAKDMASEGYDSDYFLEAQARYPDSPDLEVEWTKNMSVSNVSVKGMTATAIVSFGDNGKLARERISLMQATSVWKIDSVKALYPEPK